MNRGELKALLQQAENIVPKVKGTQEWLSATLELFAVFFFRSKIDLDTGLSVWWIPWIHLIFWPNQNLLWQNQFRNPAAATDHMENWYPVLIKKRFESAHTVLLILLIDMNMAGLLLTQEAFEDARMFQLLCTYVRQRGKISAVWFQTKSIGYGFIKLLNLDPEPSR